MPALTWGATINAAPIVWVSGTITVYDALGAVVIDAAAADLADAGATLSWQPDGMPDVSEPTLYRVRWRGVTADGSVWKSRPLINWLVEADL